MVSRVSGPAGAGGGLASMKAHALLGPPPVTCAVRVRDAAWAAAQGGRHITATVVVRVV